MPITITFDIVTRTLRDANDRNRIRQAFQRFGWETIGGTAYRYPPLNVAPGNPPPVEDWFNHVIPALMYMRSLVERKRIQLRNFTIDAVSSTGWRGGVGPHIQPSAEFQMQPITARRDVLSEERLRQWLVSTVNATV